MQGKLMKNGQYELFESTKGHQILKLNDAEFYAIIEGQRGDILVHSDSGHEKKSLQETGEFYLAEFKNDPAIRDVPHLFLESSEKYREFLLPNGLPDEKHYQKKLIRSEESRKKNRERTMPKKERTTLKQQV